MTNASKKDDLFEKFMFEDHDQLTLLYLHYFVHFLWIFHLQVK